MPTPEPRNGVLIAFGNDAALGVDLDRTRMLNFLAACCIAAGVTVAQLEAAYRDVKARYAIAPEPEGDARRPS